MRKLQLNLDQLRVESFHPAAPERRVGTVRARGSTEETDCTYDNHTVCVECNTRVSCNVTCYDTCACGYTDFYDPCP